MSEMPKTKGIPRLLSALQSKLKESYDEKNILIRSFLSHIGKP